MDEAYNVQGSGEKLLNCDSSTKRNFLNECIRHLHINNGLGSPTIHVPATHNKLVIWHIVNDLIRPPSQIERPLSLQKVRRRLFFESKKVSRKAKKPKRNNFNYSEVMYFKPSRCCLGVGKIPRNFLHGIGQQMPNNCSQNLKRKRTDLDGHSETETSPLYIKRRHKFCHQPFTTAAMEGRIKHATYNEVSRVSRRALKLEEMLLEQQYRQLSATNDKYLEASIRSILYMKTLMGIVTMERHARDDRV